MKTATYHGYTLYENGTIEKRTGRPMCGAANNAGYIQVSITIDGKRTYPTLHSLIMRLFVGPRPEGMVINHRDGNKRNNALSNLEYCTPKENSAHAIALGLVPPCTVRGSNHKRAKVTESDVQDIRKRLLAAEHPKDIAELYSISPSLVYRIRNGKAWGWLKSATASYPPSSPRARLRRSCGRVLL